MSKISVITSIVNMEKLNNEILMYKVEYKTDPYLFMSKGTFYALSEDFSNSTGETLSDWSTGYFANTMVTRYLETIVLNTEKLN